MPDMSNRLLAGSIILMAVAISAGLFLFSGDVTSGFNKVSFIDNAGMGILAPACGSSSACGTAAPGNGVCPTCSGGAPFVNFTWDADAGVPCVEVKIETNLNGRILGNLACDNGSASWTGGANNTTYNYEVRVHKENCVGCASSGSSIAALDSNNIFISAQVKGEVRLLKTTDAGATWEQFTIDAAGGTIAEQSIKVIDQNNIFVAYYIDIGDGFNLKFARTNDGGRTWNYYYSFPAYSGLGISIDAVNANTIFIASQDDLGRVKFHKTTDGGASWTSINAATLGGGKFSSIKAIDSNNIYLSFQNANKKLSFTKTSDGGTTWQAVQNLDTLGNTGRFISMDAVGGSVFISYYNVTDSSLKFIKSNGAGNVGTWSAPLVIESTGLVGSFSSLDASDSNNIFVSYHHAGQLDIRIAKSSDGGNSWSILGSFDTNNDTGQYSSIQALNSNNLLVVYGYYEDDGTNLIKADLNLAKSFDGAASWPTIQRGIDNVITYHTVGNGHLLNAGSFTTNVCNLPPTASASISTDGVSYSNIITVQQGVPTRVYLSAAGSADPDGWPPDVADNGRCEWNANLDSIPNFETLKTQPANPTACNLSNMDVDQAMGDGNLDGYITFNDPPNTTYTYQVLRVFDGNLTSAPATVQVRVDPAPPLSVSCSVSPTTIQTGQSATWTAVPVGGLGAGSYSYSWSGTDGLTGNTQTVNKVYNTAGAKTASVNLTSGAQSTGPVACSNTLNVNSNLPNLRIHEHAIQPSGGFDINTNVRFTGRVRNHPGGSVGTAFAPFNARFCVDSTSATNCLKGIDGTILGNPTITTNLLSGDIFPPTGQAAFLSSNYLVTDYNWHNAYFCVDSGEVINESDETPANNCSTFQFRADRPDLLFTSFTVPSAAPGSTVNASLTIQNTSTVSTGSGFRVEIVTNGSSMNCATPSNAFSDQSALGAGASRNVTIPITLPSTQGGYTAVAMVDSNGIDPICAITESNEGNNTRTTNYNAFPPDFDIKPNPNALTATISGSGNVNTTQTRLTIVPWFGFSSSVTLDCPNIGTVIPGASCVFESNNNVLDSSEYSSGVNMHLIIPPNTEERAYNITVRGRDNGGVVPDQFADPVITLNIKVRDPNFREVFVPFTDMLASFVPEFVKSAFAAF